MSRRILPLILAAPLLLPSPVSAEEERPKLELSLEEAVKRALENNVDIAVQRFNPQFSGEAAKATQGYYDPQAFGTLLENSVSTPQTSAFSGGATVTQKTFTYNVGVNQYLPSGASVRLEFDNSRTTTNSIFVLFNPSYASTLTASVTQPLLKNMRMDLNREQIKVAKKNREISDVQFQQTVATTISNVKQAYYDYITALDNMDAAQKSLGLAQKLLEENKIKVRVGTLAPLDVVEAESEVASREQDVITAESRITDSEDSLKAAIFPKDDPATWALQVVPTDRATPSMSHVDVGAALKTAAEKRTDLVVARKNLEALDISVQYAKSQSLPQLDLVASYGGQGVGGDQFIRQGLGGPVTQVIPGGYGDATSEVFKFTYPTWKVGVNFTYPIGNRTAGAYLAQARINKDQATVVLHRLELEVATEIRSAARAVETNIKRVDAAKAARVLQEQRLDAEQKKFSAGMSTNFLVTQAQRDLATAVFTEISTVNDYNKSVVNFERTQIAGPGSLSTSAYSTALSGSSPASTPTTTTASTTSTSSTGSTSTSLTGSASPLTSGLSTTTVQSAEKPRKP
jgi:outer membrane protein TolC